MPRLLGRRVLVKQDIASQTIGSIAIPESARARNLPQQGVVTAIGPDVKTVQVGDRVLFGKYAPLPVDQVGLVLNEQDIMAVLASASGMIGDA
jgi:chaperonin GroES